jgi:hypothetical protein
VTDGGRSERMQAMLRELELRVEQARGHEQRMHEGLAESATWGESADREWIKRAAVDATTDRQRAEESLSAARAVVKVFPGLELEASRTAIARYRCGATWVLPVCAVRRTLPGTHAHTPGALICSCCGNTATLDAGSAPQPSTNPQESMP